MMWVCRPGQKGVYLEKFISEKRIFLAWDGFKCDLNELGTRDDFKNLVINERHPESRTSVSNWSGQLFSFCKEMQIGDYVLIPHRCSKKYALAKIVGMYEYNGNDILYHSHKIALIRNDIPRDIFNQSTQYSLGAFRTIFKVREQELVLKTIAAWKE